MSTITLTLTATSVVVSGGPASITASVTNAASVPARVVLGAFPSPEGTAGAAPWTSIDRPLRDVAAGATEQYTVTIAPPPGAAAGDHVVRLIAYDADRAPEEYSDQARSVQVRVPEEPKVVVSGTPWWVYAIAGALVLAVAVVAFVLLRGDPDPVPPESPATATATPVNPCPSPFVPRLSRPGDDTCVMPASAEEAAWDNREDVQRNRRLPAPFADQCSSPYQPRLAFDDDFVCVWEDTANRTHVENQAGYTDHMFGDDKYPEKFTPRR